MKRHIEFSTGSVFNKCHFGDKVKPEIPPSDGWLYLIARTSRASSGCFIRGRRVQRAEDLHAFNPSPVDVRERNHTVPQHPESKGTQHRGERPLAFFLKTEATQGDVTQPTWTLEPLIWLEGPRLMLTYTVVKLDFTESAESTVREALCSENATTYGTFTKLEIYFSLNVNWITKIISRSRVVNLIEPESFFRGAGSNERHSIHFVFCLTTITYS